MVTDRQDLFFGRWQRQRQIGAVHDRKRDRDGLIVGSRGVTGRRTPLEQRFGPDIISDKNDGDSGDAQ